jgi:hypothetical protein
MDDDWHDLIEVNTSASWYDLFHYRPQRVNLRQTLTGSVVFYRRSKRRLRTRYVVCQADDRGFLHITNAEIRYRKSRKAWGVYINNTPVRHYRSLKGAKMSLMPGVLDRMGAEGDRCLDPPCSERSSKNEA